MGETANKKPGSKAGLFRLSVCRGGAQAASVASSDFSSFLSPASPERFGVP
jgi:hypothetical protein